MKELRQQFTICSPGFACHPPKAGGQNPGDKRSSTYQNHVVVLYLLPKRAHFKIISFFESVKFPARML